MLKRAASAKSATAATEARIRVALRALAPLIGDSHADGVTLVRWLPETGVAELRLDGGCRDCDLRTESLLQGIEAHVRLRVPEVRAVRPAQPTNSHG